MSLRIILGCLLALLTLGALLSLSPTSQGAVEDWHIQTPHTVVGEAKSFQKDPVVSPNGTRIAYASKEDGGANFDIWTMSIEGSQKLQMTDNPWDEIGPAYTPDGRYLTLVDRWGSAYLLRSDGSESLYPHRDQYIWDNLTYENSTYDYTYELVPAIIYGFNGADPWLVDSNNWSVVAYNQDMGGRHTFKLVELPPIVHERVNDTWVNHSRPAAPPYQDYSWWATTNGPFSFAKYNESARTWGGCDGDPCWPDLHEAYATPEWLDVVSVAPASVEQEGPVTKSGTGYLLAAYDNSSYLNLYLLTIPARDDGVEAYDWEAVSLVQLTSNSTNQKDPVLNREEQNIYYVSKEDGDKYYDIWKMDLAGQNRQQVTFEDYNQLSPTFDPGFNELYFASDEHGDYLYDIFKTASQPGIQLTDFEPPRAMYHIYGQQGPGGVVTYLAPDNAYNLQVFVGNLDGTGAIQLTESQHLNQMGFNFFSLKYPRLNSAGDTVAVDILYQSEQRGYVEWRFAQLLIHRVGETWESRDIQVISAYRADSSAWLNEGSWYNATHIAFDPTDAYMALPSDYRYVTNPMLTRSNTINIYDRNLNSTWRYFNKKLDLDAVPGYDAYRYVHHSPAWVSANRFFMLRADLDNLTANGHETLYEIVQVYAPDGWGKRSTVEITPTGLSGEGLAQLTATANSGLKLAWSQPRLETGQIKGWDTWVAAWNPTLEEWEDFSLETSADGLSSRANPVFLDGRNLLYTGNDPRDIPWDRKVFIYDPQDEVSRAKSGANAASSINGLQVSPDGTEVVFLGKQLQEGTAGDGNDEGGGGPQDLGTGPILWFYNLEQGAISQENIDEADCVGCDLQTGDRFSLTMAHYRTSNLMLLTLFIEHWEDRGTGEELVGVSSLDIYLYNRQQKRLTPLLNLNTEFEELVSDVQGDRFLYATDRGNVLGTGDVWLAEFNGQDQVTLTNLTELPYLQWGAIFGPTNSTIYYLSDESGEEYQHIWQLTRLGPKWTTFNLPTQLTTGRTNYQAPYLASGKNLLLYAVETDSDRSHDLYLLDLDTGQKVAVANSPADEAMAVYNSVTDQILYVKKGDGFNTFDQLYAINFDGDGDGYTENLDAFPSNPAEWNDHDGDGIGDNADKDDDNDLHGSDGIPGTYDDGDGKVDTEDAFPLDPSEWLDTDGDGIGNNADAFDLDPAASVDTDGDGYPDGWNPGKTEADSTTGLTLDAFPTNDNEFKDTDGDGQGDNADSDLDGDSVSNSLDDFSEDPAASLDTDDDGKPDSWNKGYTASDSTLGLEEDTDDDNDQILDNVDAFPTNANEWLDTDGDGIGDNTDSDDDNDGVADAQDLFPLDGGEWADSDDDGVGDNSDSDRDGDGIPNGEDAFPDDPSEWVDTDKDGYGDNEDPDADGDGIPDEDDEAPTDDKAGYWDLPVMGQASSKKVKDSLKAFSPILLSLIAGPFAFLLIKRTRYGHYKRVIRKIDNAKALHDFYRFDMEVAMYNWKVWWKHQMKLREQYVEKMKELGGDPYLPAPDKDIYRPKKGDELESGLE